MQQLEKFLDKFDNKEIHYSIKSMYEEFGYESYELFCIDLEFMLNNLYNIKLIDYKRKRIGQEEFRKNLIEKFGGKCILTGVNCLAELTACHIVPVSENENYDVDNGLLLTENLHRTFDRFIWSINPNTMKVEVNDNENIGTIKDYKDNTVLLEITPNLYINLLYHYNKFTCLKKLIQKYKV